jgi:glycosyltransferase involved in cell wall biosynthesis
MKYNLIIDGRMLIGHWRLRGISKYMRSLVENQNSNLFLSPKTKLDNYLPSNKTIKFGFKSYFLWEQISLPLKLMFIKHNYVLLPSTTAPIISKSNKSIFVVYDLIFLKNVNRKTTRQKISSFYRRWITSLNIKTFKEIICISQHTKKEIIENYCLKPNQKITVIHCSIEDKWFENDKNIIGDEKYLLTVSGSHESKNLIRVLEAFKNFNSSLKNKYKLKVVGISGSKDTSFRKKLSLKKLLDFVEIVPTVNDDKLIDLYDNAKLSLTLSTHEGFGFPVVEAMSRKTPVLASNCSSIPEVAGPNAIYCNPYCIQDITSKLMSFHKMSKDNINEMVNINYIHSKKFSEQNLKSKVNSFWENLGEKN